MEDILSFPVCVRSRLSRFGDFAGRGTTSTVVADDAEEALLKALSVLALSVPSASSSAKVEGNFSAFLALI